MRNFIRQSARIAAASFAMAVLGTSGTYAYESYDDSTIVGDQNCSSCHPDFKSVGALHNSHVINFDISASPGVIDNRCNVCHTNGGGSTPVYTMGSNQVQGNGFGCAGCHGQNYGEVASTAPYTGDPKASGWGLRQVHISAGLMQCGSGGCHGLNPFTPLDETSAPPYYSMNISRLANPCFSGQEDLPYDMDSVGLDNDGNGTADFPADLNCGPTTTTSTSTTSTTLPAQCSPAPLVGCIAAEKAKLQINEKTAGKEKVKFNLTKLVPAVAQSDFGDPVTTGTSYALCVYDQSNALVVAYEVARAGQTCGDDPCWEDFKGIGWQFADKDLDSDGVSKIQLAGGEAGKGKIKLQGKNDWSTLPTGIAALLSGDTSATAQLISNDAECFGMALPTVKKNDGLIFQAAAP